MKHGSPGLTFSPDGTPHAYWIAGRHAVVHAQRNASGWELPDTIATSAFELFQLQCLRAPDGTSWLVWIQGAGEKYDIYVTHDRSGVWSTPHRVHPENGLYNFRPRIAAGPHTIWICWYGGPAPGRGYHIRVVRGDEEGWTEPQVMTAEMAGFHWFSDLAVDSEDRVHLVWGETNSRALYHRSSPDGVEWTTPFVLALPLLGVATSSWPGCSAAFDIEGNLHVAWVGQRVVDAELEDWDIFYSSFDGEHWTVPHQVNVDNATTDAYPDLTVRSSQEIWICWMDGDPMKLEEYRTLAAVSSNGRDWSQWRINDDTHYFDGSGMITLDPDDHPWVVWDAGHEDLQRMGNVLCSRFDPSVPVVMATVCGLGLADAAEVHWTTPDDAYAGFKISRSRDSSVEDAVWVPSSGSGDYVWVDRHVDPGLWNYHVWGIDRLGGRRLLGSVRIEVGTAPHRLALESVGRETGGSFRLRLGLPAPSNVYLDIFDVQGRLLGQDDIGPFGAGWTELTWSMPGTRGSTPRAGVYWLRARTTIGEETTVRLVAIAQ